MQSAVYRSSAQQPIGLALAAAVSIGLHALAAWGVYDLPLGHIDPRLLTDKTVLPVQLIEAGVPITPQPASEADASVPAEIAPSALSAAVLEAIQAPPLPPSAPSRSPGAFPEPGGLPDSGKLAPDGAGVTPWLAQAGSPSATALHLDGRGTDGPRSTTPPPPAIPPTMPDAARSMLDMITDRWATPATPPAVTMPPSHSRSDRDATAVALPDYTATALDATTRLDVPEHLDHDFDYHLTVYRAPRGPDYFRVDMTGRRSLSRLRTMAKDVVFLVDTSGSVAQAWVEATTAGIQDALSALNDGDRFNIVLFDEQPRFFSPRGIRPVNERSLAEARTFLSGAHSRGYTDVNQALSRLLVRDVAGDRVYSLVLISDGKPTRGVMNTRDLIERITRDNDLNAGIYCVGIGSGQNRTLLDYLAYRNRGDSHFVKRAADTVTVIQDLVSRIRFPILKQVDLNAVGVDAAEVVPKALPDIHQGQRSVIFGRFDRDVATDLTIRVEGSNHGQTYDFTFRRSLDRAEAGTEQIARDWAVQKLHHLYGEMLEAEDPGRVKKHIDRLRKQFKLKSF